MRYLSTIKAVVFDMDGLLLDTETLALHHFIESCKACGITPDINVYYQCIGTTSTRTKEILIEGHGEGFPFEAISKIWSKNYQTAILNEKIPLKRGVINLLDFFKDSEKTMAVATSTEYETAKIKLKNSRIHHYFDIVIGGDQVTQGKPDPEIYLKAAKQLNVSPRKCLAFEDSNTGVISAYRAGMHVIQVPDLIQPSADVLKLGHVILDSLDDAYMMLKNRETDN